MPFRPASGKDSVSHAAGISVEHDVFNRPDFFSLRRFHFRADNFTGLDVSGAAGSSALGLGERRSHGQAQKGCCYCKYD